MAIASTAETTIRHGNWAITSRATSLPKSAGTCFANAMLPVATLTSVTLGLRMLLTPPTIVSGADWRRSPTTLSWRARPRTGMAGAGPAACFRCRGSTLVAQLSSANMARAPYSPQGFRPLRASRRTPTQMA